MTAGTPLRAVSSVPTFPVSARSEAPPAPSRPPQGGSLPAPVSLQDGFQRKGRGPSFGRFKGVWGGNTKATDLHRHPRRGVVTPPYGGPLSLR